MAASQTGLPEIGAALVPLLHALAWDNYSAEADPIIPFLYPKMNDLARIGVDDPATSLEGNHTWYMHDKAFGNERLRTGRANFSGGNIYSSNTTQFTVGPPTIPLDDFYVWSEDDAAEVERFRRGVMGGSKSEILGKMEDFVNQFHVENSDRTLGQQYRARDLRAAAHLLMGDSVHQNEHPDYVTTQTDYRGHFQSLNAHATMPASLPMSGVTTGMFYWGNQADQTTAMYGQNRQGGASGVTRHANQWLHFDDYRAEEHSGWAVLSRTMSADMAHLGLNPKACGQPVLITPEHTAVTLFNYYANRNIPLYVQIVGDDDRAGEKGTGRNQSVDPYTAFQKTAGFVLPTLNLIQYGRNYGQVTLRYSRVWDDANTQIPTQDLGSTKSIRRSGSGSSATAGGLGYLFFPDLMIPRHLQPMKGKGDIWSKVMLNVTGPFGSYKTDSMWWVREPLATNEYMENKVPMSRLAGWYYPALCAGAAISGLENGLDRHAHGYNTLITA